MARLSVGLTALVLFGFASAALAQDGQPVVHTSHKTHAKKAEAHAKTVAAHAAVTHAKKVQDSNDYSEDWTLAAPKSSSSRTDISEDPNVSEGRKKFFNQSTTMENGGPAGASSGRSSGFTPSMGMSF
jgi:hypothetical protein